MLYLLKINVTAAASNRVKMSMIVAGALSPVAGVPEPMLVLLEPVPDP
jgi:hypothetical protein